MTDYADTAEPKVLIRETYDVETPEAAPAPEVREPVVRQTARAKADPYIWGIYLIILVYSIIELFSASSSEVDANNVYSPLIRHGIFLLIGFGLVILHQNMPYQYFKHYAKVIGIVSLVLLLATSFIGITINGAQRAIRIAGFTVQPAEIVKLTVVVWLSSVLATNQMRKGVTTKGVVIAATIILVFSAALYKNGFTNTVLLMGVSMCLFIVSGIQSRKFIMVLVVYVVAGGIFYVVKHSSEAADEFDQVAQVENTSTDIDREGTRNNRWARWQIFVDPNEKMNDFNRQVILANIAQANGGLTGKGPGNSRESARLPLAFSDYIFSIIVEDTGFLGGVILMLFYIFLLFRAGVIARKCSRAFPAFLIMGCAFLIVFQALIHMMIVVGLTPVSGQPLPFISKGGTSIIVMSIAIGMMLSVSRYAVTSGNRKEINAELSELPEDMQAANPTFVNPNKK